jgi:hypothetical protein
LKARHSDYACLEYDCQSDAGQTAFTSRLREILEVIESAADRPDNPVGDFLTDTSIRLFQFQREENLRKLRALEMELEVWKLTMQKSIDVAEATGRHEVTLFRFQAPALEHLLATQYIVNTDLNFDGRLIHTFFFQEHSLSIDRAKQAIAMFEEFYRNVERITTAVEAGNPVDSVKLDRMKVPPTEASSVDSTRDQT